MTLLKWQIIPRLILFTGILAAAGCRGSSEPLRRIEALETRVERLEQAAPVAGEIEFRPAGGSEPLRRIERLEARVQRLEQAARSERSVESGSALDGGSGE